MRKLKKKSQRVNFSFFLLIVFVLAGCRSKKVLSDVKHQQYELQALDNVLHQAKPQYQTLNITGRAQFESLKEKQNFNYRIKILKDSLIWISVNVLGIEGYRVLIKTDSITVIDRINKRFYVTTYAPIQKLIGMSVDFELLEDILLGVLPSKIMSSNLVGKNSVSYQFKTAQEKKVLFLELKTDLLRLDNLKIYEKKQLIAMLIFSEYQHPQKIPHRLNLEGFSNEPVKLKLQHSKVEVNPNDISFSFQIPDDYERKN